METGSKRNEECTWRPAGDYIPITAPSPNVRKLDDGIKETKWKQGNKVDANGNWIQTLMRVCQPPSTAHGLPSMMRCAVAAAADKPHILLEGLVEDLGGV